MSAKLNTWSKVYAAARKGTVNHDYFAPRGQFKGREHDQPVQVGDRAYFIDSIANDDGTNRRYRVNRISADGVVERAPFNPRFETQYEWHALKEAVQYRDDLVYHESIRLRALAKGFKLDE